MIKVNLMNTQIPMGRIGCSAVILKDRKVLLTKRAPQLKRCPKMWTLPAGGIDPTDSSLEACVIREAKEEVGLDFKPTGKFGFYESQPADGKRNISLAFLGEWSGECVWQPEEVTEGDFFTYAQSQELEMAFSYAEVLKDLKAADLID